MYSPCFHKDMSRIVGMHIYIYMFVYMQNTYLPHPMSEFVFPRSCTVPATRFQLFDHIFSSLAELGFLLTSSWGTRLQKGK